MKPLTNPHINEILVISEASEKFTQAVISFRPLLVFATAIIGLVMLDRVYRNTETGTLFIRGFGKNNPGLPILGGVNGSGNVKVIQYEFHTTDWNEAKTIYEELKKLNAKSLGTFGKQKSNLDSDFTITGVLLDDGKVIDFMKDLGLKNSTVGFRSFTIDHELAKSMKLIP